MQKVKEWLIEREPDLVEMCFPPRNQTDKFSNKSLWLYITETLS
jgi:hypothetical protein